MGGKEERGPAGMSQATGRGGFHCWEGTAGGEGSRLTGGKEGFCCSRVYKRQGMTAGNGQRGLAHSRVYTRQGITRLEDFGFRVRGREGLGLGFGLGLGSLGSRGPPHYDWGPWGPSAAGKALV